MRPVSAAFAAAVTGSHAMTAQAVLLTSYADGVNPSGTPLAVGSGDVQLDATAQVRSTLSLVTDGTGWDARAGKSPLQPYGSEIFARRGVAVAGSTEYVSLGYFRIQSVSQAEPPDGPVTVAASDRMQAIIDEKIITPVSFTRDDTVSGVFAALVGDVYPAAVVDFDYDATGDQLGMAMVTGQDRYQFLYDLAASRGKIMFWDYQGHLTVKDVPDPSSPVLDLAAGEGGVLVSAARTADRTGVVNAVVATADGASSANPPAAVAYDRNAASLTRWGGPFGRVPAFWSSSQLTTAQQAQAAAGSLLRRAAGLPYEADFTAVPNPALEPLDPVRLRYERSGFETHVVSSLTIPLTADQAMSGTTRDQSGIAIAVSDLTLGSVTG